MYRFHQKEIDAQPSEKKRLDRLCELNVIEQVANVCHTTMVQNAWKSGQGLAVHGWIYRVSDGILRDLNVCTTGIQDIPLVQRIA